MWHNNSRMFGCHDTLVRTSAFTTGEKNLSELNSNGCSENSRSKRTNHNKKPTSERHLRTDAFYNRKCSTNHIVNQSSIQRERSSTSHGERFRYVYAFNKMCSTRSIKKNNQERWFTNETCLSTFQYHRT